MRAHDLTAAINSVRHAAGDRTGDRPILDGICFQLDLDRLTLAAADGWIMARTTIAGSFDTEWRGVLPLGAVRVLKFLLEESEDVTIEVRGAGLLFTTNLAWLMIPRRPEKPLDYGRVLQLVDSAPVCDAMPLAVLRGLPAVGSYEDGAIVEIVGTRVQRRLIENLTTGLPDTTKVLVRKTGDGRDVIGLEALQSSWRGVVMPLSAGR